MVSYHVLYKKIFQFINFLLFEASGTKELFTYSMYVVVRKVKQGLETHNNILTPCYNYVQVETISKTWTFVHLWKVSKPNRYNQINMKQWMFTRWLEYKRYCVYECIWKWSNYRGVRLFYLNKNGTKNLTDLSS